MRVHNWRKKISASLVAAGLLSPAAAWAVNITLGDPSFEAFNTVPLGGPSAQFAYSNSYRPTSAWIDDQDHFDGDYVEDDGDSNWLYSAAYAETGANHRGSPRTGNQALHGFFRYSSQATGATFEAGKTYTFSIYAQADNVVHFDFARLYLYLFDGGQPFSEDVAIVANSFAPPEAIPPGSDFVSRPASATQAQSQALWQQVSIRHTVYTGDAEVGQPIGVGFYLNHDMSVDDASLTAETNILTLEVNTTSGATRILNETGKVVNLDYYEITSAGNSLKPATWTSVHDLHPAGFPQGNGSGNGWEEADLSDDGVLSESYLLGNSPLANNGELNLGTAYQVGDPQDLVFKYGQVTPDSLTADFDQNGNVDGADLLRQQRGLGSFGPAVNVGTGNANTDKTVNGLDLAVFEGEFGNNNLLNGAGLQIRGNVRYVTSAVTAIPEPDSIVVAGLGLAAAVKQQLMKRRRRDSVDNEPVVA